MKNLGVQEHVNSIEENGCKRFMYTTMGDKILTHASASILFLMLFVYIN